MAQWVCRSLVRLYPHSFRQRYGREMAAAFSAQARERLETAGVARVVTWGHVFSRRRQRLQRFLVIVQVAVSFVLLVGAGLMVRTLVKLHEVDPGFRSENVLTMTVDLNWSHYEGEEQFRGFFTELLDELAQRSVTVTACWLPARYASRVQPIDALRQS